MPKLMRSLLAWLEGKVASRPLPPPPGTGHSPHRLHRRLPSPAESPLDGDASPLVRPYLLAHERGAERRERAFLYELGVAW
ncbi:hypothetical protein [Streptomyces lydicus]|uniref:hypothetical protein n=1 Tax=Streptomyces lydicus TaxID=47763 RepID=UPI00131BA78A|nr:hypothetical protein [Streptomyces lydicus]